MVVPVLGDAIRRKIRDARTEMVEALYPIIGQMVVRAVSEAMRDLARSIDARRRDDVSDAGRTTLLQPGRQITGLIPPDRRCV